MDGHRPSQLARALLDYEGRGPVPFRPHGRLIDYADGLDCLGLLIYVGWQLGYPRTPAFDRKDYGAEKYGPKLFDWLGEWFDPAQEIAVDTVIVGRVKDGVDAYHMGIVGAHPFGGLTLIHCTDRTMRVTEQGLGGAKIRQVAGIFSFRNG